VALPSPAAPIVEVAAPTSSGSQTIATVERAVDVLMLFTRRRSATLGVTEIANELAMSKAAVHRILSSLRGKGLLDVHADTRRYSLGPGTLALGLAYLDTLDVRDLAHGELTALSDASGETATLSIRSGSTRTYVSQVLPDREVKMTVQLGRPFPLHTGSSSKAFLAYLTEEEIDEYLTHPLDALTPTTITDPEALRADLRSVRKVGYAVSFGERQAGAGSVAAPVFDHAGRPAAVISVCGPIERFRDEVDDVATLLVAATKRLSARMGFVS
jgi:IclR family transcriptional regulator, acetate operon repressor